MDHIAQIAGKLADHQLDAMLLASQAGERYAVGFHGEGLVLVTREGAHYSTDSRYIEAARQEVQGAQVELVTRERGHLALAAGYLQEHGLKRVGFESGAVSVDALARYERALPCTLVPAQDLPDGLRASKDRRGAGRHGEGPAHHRRGISGDFEFYPPGADGAGGGRPAGV